jgi:D-lactate dehydrogenase
MKVIVYSVRSYDKPALERAAQGKHQVIFTEERLNASTVDYARGCEAAAIFTSDDASAPVLYELYQRGVRYLLLRCVGYDHVDIEHATSLGISVANVPAYSPYSVAEHAVAMLLAVNRKLVEGQRLIALQDYRINTLKGFDVHGKTVGIIGTGKIGMAFTRIMIGFGAKVLATDPQQDQEALELGVRYVPLEELLRVSDIVSIHCPLNKLTRHLLGKEEFNLMKPNAIVVNTSRGAVINTVDLIEALDNRKLGGACLDVYEFEKGLFFEDRRGDIIHDLNFARLRSFKNVLITCHQGFLTEDAITEIAEATMANIDSFQNGTRCKNQLNRRDDGKEKIESDVLTIQSL